LQVAVRLLGRRIRKLGHEWQYLLGCRCGRMHAAPSEFRYEFDGINAGGWHGPFVLRWSHGMWEPISDNEAANGLSGVAGEPVEHAAHQPLIRKDIPDGLRSARGARHRADVPRRPIRFRETEDLMLIGVFPGRNRSPEDRREHRGEAGDVTHDAAVEELLEMRHVAAVQERPNHLPVGPIPTDQQDTFGKALHGNRRYYR